MRFRRALIVLLVVAMLGASLHTLGQEVRSPDSKPEKLTIRWRPEMAYSDRLMVEGHEVKAINYIDASGKGPMTVAVSLDMSGDYMGLLVEVLNRSGRRATVDPKKCFIGSQSFKNQVLLPVDSERVARSIEKNGKWKRALAVGLSGMATRQTTGTVTNSQTGETSSVTLSTQDYEAQRRVAAAARARAANNRERADTIRDISLLANTIPTDSYILGWVFFEKKSFDKVLVFMEIEDVTYVFPFDKP